MTDPDPIVIRPAFRDALAALQADYDARCETCAHSHRPGKLGQCGVYGGLRVWLDMTCPEWEART